MNKKYEAIIDLPHPVSHDRPRMTTMRRAAQFAPFAALTGFDAMLAETARRIDGKICLDEGEVAAIDAQLRRIKQKGEPAPMVKITFFCPDGRKEGGRYCTVHSKMVKIDEYCQNVLLETGDRVSFADIIQLLVE